MVHGIQLYGILLGFLPNHPEVADCSFRESRSGSKRSGAHPKNRLSQAMRHSVSGSEDIGGLASTPPNLQLNWASPKGAGPIFCARPQFDGGVGHGRQLV